MLPLTINSNDRRPLVEQIVAGIRNQIDDRHLPPSTRLPSIRNFARSYHISRGKFDDVALDGLNVALAVHAPGTMVATKWKAAVYVDDQTSDAQKDALLKIFSGQAGGHPAVLASFVGEMLGVKSTPMHFQGEGKTRRLSIPGVAEAEIEALEGQNGQPVTITNHPLCVAPGEPATVARSKRLRFTDYGMDWQLSGRNGLMSDFAYQST
jgi:hypothetical protein